MEETIESGEDFIEHYGVPGMKWGVRKSRQELRGYGTSSNQSRRARKSEKKVAKAQKRYDRKLKKNWASAYNSAADYANQELIPKINKKYEKYDFSDLNTPSKKRAYDRYINEYTDSFNKRYDEIVIEMFGKRPS